MRTQREARFWEGEDGKGLGLCWCWVERGGGKGRAVMEEGERTAYNWPALSQSSASKRGSSSPVKRQF